MMINVRLSILKIALSTFLSLACALAYAQSQQNVGNENASSAGIESLAAQRVVPNDYAENYAFADSADRKTFLQLTEVLRCPKCQNQNIADSDAPIAHDMRRKVYQLMQEGKGETEVINWMKQRYGDFVYYQPPVNAVTLWLWLAPVLFAFIMLFVFIKRRKAPEELDVEARLARAEQLLKDE